MSCRLSITKLPQAVLTTGHSPKYITLNGAIVVPIFCVCMIAAMGAVSGIRHAISMQFTVDKDTDFIVAENAEYLYLQKNNRTILQKITLT